MDRRTVLEECFSCEYWKYGFSIQRSITALIGQPMQMLQRIHQASPRSRGGRGWPPWSLRERTRHIPDQRTPQSIPRSQGLWKNPNHPLPPNGGMSIRSTSRGQQQIFLFRRERITVLHGQPKLQGFNAIL